MTDLEITAIQLAELSQRHCIYDTTEEMRQAILDALKAAYQLGHSDAMKAM